MPSDVPGCTRATMIVAVSIYFQTLPLWILQSIEIVSARTMFCNLFHVTCQLNLLRKQVGNQLEVTISFFGKHNFWSIWYCELKRRFRFAFFLLSIFIWISVLTLFNSRWGQTIVNCWSRFNQECLVRVGSSNHPEYVPALCTHRPSLLPMDFSVRLRDWVFIDLRKLIRTGWSKGKRSRNKASVGEPADGSLRTLNLRIKTHMILVVWKLESNPLTRRPWPHVWALYT